MSLLVVEKLSLVEVEQLRNGKGLADNESTNTRCL